MSKVPFPVLGILILILLMPLSLSGCSKNNPDSELPVDRPEPPEEYYGKTNPFANDKAAIQAGEKIYRKNCTSCHGDSGSGDGPAASSMEPKPQDLTKSVSTLADDYLFWRISEGGEMKPFNSGMLAWKSILTEQERWQVVTYLRTLRD